VGGRDVHLLRIENPVLHDSMKGGEGAAGGLHFRANMALGLLGGPLEVTRSRVEVLDECLVVELNGHAVIATQVALDARPPGIPTYIAGGNQSARNIARGDLNQPRSLG